jgi:hypothetical protein
MNPLASRKKLLIAESELNRAQLVRDWRTMTDDIHALTSHIKTITTFTSAAAALLAGLGLFRRKKSASFDEKPSWWRTILQGAQLAVPLWRAFHARPKQ